MKDLSKPDGDAVNDDGSLKQANEISWFNSPSDEHPLRNPEDNVSDGQGFESMDIQDIDEDRNEDGVGEENNETKEGENNGISEDEDEEAEERYWEAKTKEGDRKVLCLTILEAAAAVH
jgi:hypothetical protein